MKKVISILILVIMVGFLLIQLVPYGRNHTNPPVVQEPKWDSPETRATAKRACFDCHSNETVWPWYSQVAPVSWLVQRDVDEGRQRVNFSDWGKSREVGEIIEEVAEGGMPPAQYLPMHPEAKLTAAERDAFIKGLQATLSNP